MSANRDEAATAPGEGAAVDAEGRIGVRPILPILNQVHNGALFDRMSVELARLVTEVVHNTTGKGAKLILELSIDKPGAKMHLTGREILLTATLKSKAPDDPPDAHVFYFDDEGGLHLRDPYQRPMFSGPKAG